jgi:CO/xanthine dehydrogenase Mo-binding subunit
MNLEVERYELRDIPLFPLDLDRREFFGLLVVLLAATSEAAAQETGAARRRAGLPKEIGAWLHIAEDGAVTVYTGKAELGQNTRTALTQAVAEELAGPLHRIRLVMADTGRTPFDAGTFGSQSTPVMSPQLRRVAAAAREVLLGQAAALWKVDRAALAVENGKVVHASSSRSVPFGELTKGQKLVETVAGDVPLRPAADWKVMGTPVPKIDGRDFVTGRHQYTSDLKLPGMLHGRVLRPPSFGATLVSLETAAAEAAGARVVRDGEFAGVAASDSPAATAALALLKAEWKTQPQPSDAELFDLLTKEGGRRRAVHTAGNAAEALQSAPLHLTQTYRLAYIAHAPLEPRAAVAQWEGENLTVWTGTQVPFGVRNQLAQAFGLDPAKVRVIVPDTGAAYGGKHTGECALEAARLARAAGKPVKLVWTREEEFTWAYFRPAGVIEVSAAAGRDGKLAAWRYRNYNSGTASIGLPYEAAHQEIEFFEAASPLRQGSYRALAATGNNFARESMMDELAESLALDPMEFRLRNLKEPRLRAVLSAAAEAFGWGRSGRHAGLACGTEKGSYVASCAEVSAERGVVRVTRLVTAFECGAVVNPDHLRNQVEGSMMMALGGALFERIRFANGRILNPRFSEYRVPRFSDTPELRTILLDRKDLPAVGAGETPMISPAPAIASAIRLATGIRPRSLPLTG